MFDALLMLKYDVMVITLMKTLLSHFVYVLIGASRDTHTHTFRWKNMTHTTKK